MYFRLGEYIITLIREKVITKRELQRSLQVSQMPLFGLLRLPDHTASTHSVVGRPGFETAETRTAPAAGCQRF